MTEWIKRSERVTVVEYRRSFEYTDMPGAGYSFECNEDGSFPGEPHVNYLACLSGAINGQTILDRGIVRYEHSYTEPGVIRCHCGAEVELTMVMTNTCVACITCGQDESFGWHKMTAEECEAFMQHHEGRGCSNPGEHHEYRACLTDYNSSGQRLAPQEQWGWDTGESLGEILASDWPVGVSREQWAGDDA